MRLKRGAIIGVAIASGLAAGGLLGTAWFSGEIPHWRPDGTAMARVEPLAPVGGTEPIVLRPGANIIAMGDSLTSGSHGGGKRAAYPALLAERLGAGIAVINRGVGGQTAPEGVRQWSEATTGDLVIVMYGTNDAAIRGMVKGARPVPVPRFEHVLATLVRRHRAAGSQVLLLAPPPAGSAAMNRRLAPYRQAVRKVAMATDVRFLDPASAFAGLSAPLRYDALHFRSVAERKLADWLAGAIRVEPASPVT